MAESKTGAGRPSRLAELSDEARRLILNEIRRGASIESAAAIADVHEATMYRWIQWGAEGREPYAEFATEVGIAIRAWQRDQETAISGSPDWRARAWMLERRRRKEYGSEVKVEHSGNIGRADELADDDLASIAAGGSARAASPETGEG